MIIRGEPPERLFIGIGCDGCTVKAPAQREIMKGHGLNNMGWRCYGGTHFCPSCVARLTQSAPAVVPSE